MAARISAWSAIAACRSPSSTSSSRSRGPPAAWCANTRCCSIRRRRSRAATPAPAPTPSPVDLGGAAAPTPLPPTAVRAVGARAARSRARRSARRRAARADAAAERKAAAPASRPATAAAARRRRRRDEYQVRAGDTLSTHRRAHPAPGRVARPDAGRAVPRQPEAFIGDNMNRLKAGVVLSVPSAETAKAVTAAEARQIDPRAERRLRRLPPTPGRATRRPPRPRTARARPRARSQASVDDKQAGRRADARQADAVARAARSRPAAPEAQGSRRRAEKKDAAARVAELTRTSTN